MYKVEEFWRWKSLFSAIFSPETSPQDFLKYNRYWINEYRLIFWQIYNFASIHAEYSWTTKSWGHELSNTTIFCVTSFIQPVVDALVMKPIITSVVITTTKPPPLETIHICFFNCFSHLMILRLLMEDGSNIICTYSISHLQ